MKTLVLDSKGITVSQAGWFRPRAACAPPRKTFHAGQPAAPFPAPRTVTGGDERPWCGQRSLRLAYGLAILGQQGAGFGLAAKRLGQLEFPRRWRSHLPPPSVPMWC